MRDDLRSGEELTPSPLSLSRVEQAEWRDLAWALEKLLPLLAVGEYRARLLEGAVLAAVSLPSLSARSGPQVANSGPDAIRSDSTIELLASARLCGFFTPRLDRRGRGRVHPPRPPGRLDHPRLAPLDGQPHLRARAACGWRAVGYRLLGGQGREVRRRRKEKAARTRAELLGVSGFRHVSLEPFLRLATRSVGRIKSVPRLSATMKM